MSQTDRQDRLQYTAPQLASAQCNYMGVCIAGETASSSTCSSQHYVSVTHKPVGYIISDVTQTTGVGSERCPWLVAVQRGQHIRITLYDLATSTSGSSSWSSQRQGQDGRCLLYATLREGLESDVVGDHVICSGGDARQQVVYTSRDHTLAITVHYAPASRFVLQYEGLFRRAGASLARYVCFINITSYLIRHTLASTLASLIP